MTAGNDPACCEAARRKALWTPAHLTPGDPRAVGTLNVLGEIDQPECQDASLPAQHASVGSTQLAEEPHASDWQSFLG